MKIKIDASPARKSGAKSSVLPPGGWLQYGSLTPPPSLVADGIWTEQKQKNQSTHQIKVSEDRFCYFGFMFGQREEVEMRRPSLFTFYGSDHNGVWNTCTPVNRQAFTKLYVIRRESALVVVKTKRGSISDNSDTA